MPLATESLTAYRCRGSSQGSLLPINMTATRRPEGSTAIQAIRSYRPSAQRLDCDVAALDEADFGEAPPKRGHVFRPFHRRHAVEDPDHRHRRLLGARRERPSRRRAAEQRDERAPFQLVELHFGPRARAGLQDIELAVVSQEVTKRFYNLLAVGEACACPRWVSTSIRANSCHAANGSEVLLQRPFY